MIQAYTKQFDHLMDEVVTEAVIFPHFEVGTLPPMKFYTENAAWDTGSEQTIIAPHVAEALELMPVGKEPLKGIGGLQEADSYFVAIALPNGRVFHNVKVCSLPMDDYEVLIGMDIISLCDFAITNQNAKTTFSFQTPSSQTIDFKK